ncbi:MAG: glycosyltransferase [Oscillospiraceae bacterium]|nr:glycosyltransferase [Oscillospiraceae bacterium]
MKIIFVGGLFNENQLKAVYENSKTMPNIAANVHQWNIINGLSEDVDIINPLFMGNYPSEYKKFFVGREEWSHKDGSKNISPATLNIFGLKQILRLFNLTHEIRKKIKESDENTIVMVYSLNTSFLISLRLAQLGCKKTSTCLIVPDLPYFYINNAGKSKFYRVLKTLDWKLMLHFCKNIDSFILLTEPMKNMINVGDRPYIVSEGICEADTKLYDNQITRNSITYTGTLDKEFGVLTLIRNFIAVAKEDWVLNIAGGGNAKSEIEVIASNDNRICYRGILTNEETKALQRSSRILINPRSSEEEFTKYSFPSKTMEYLKAGRPILMHKLAGIPQEYNEYLNYFENTTDHAFQQGLVDLMSKSDQELDEIGHRGKLFVEKEKNSIVQGKKIIDFLKTLAK